MGTSYNPKIVTDGLVLNLDPANVKSYPAKEDPYVNNVSLMLDGESLTDKSQNAVTVTVEGSVIVDSSFKKVGNSSLKFGGALADCLTVPSSSLFAFPGDFTIEFWTYANQFGQRSGATVYFCNGVLNQFQLALLSATQINLYLNGSSFITGSLSASAVGRWMHIALVRSGTNIRIYENGTSVASGTSSYSVPASICYIGKQLPRSPINYGHNLDGYIDDLKVTKGAKYTANFTPPTEPLSLPGRLTDLTTNKYNSTMVNGLTFDSSNSGSIVANTTNKYFTGSINSSVWTSNISMCAWFKHTGYGNLWESIFSANTSASFYGSPIMTFNGTSTGTRDQIGINNAGFSPSGIFLDLTANHLNKWIYCVITISGTTVTIYAFQDGILSSNSGTLPYTLTRTSTSYYIFRHYSGETTQIFQGNIAKIELYNKALTVSEVIQNYNATKGRFG